MFFDINKKRSLLSKFNKFKNYLLILSVIIITFVCYKFLMLNNLIIKANKYPLLFQVIQNNTLQLASNMDYDPKPTQFHMEVMQYLLELSSENNIKVVCIIANDAPGVAFRMHDDDEENIELYNTINHERDYRVNNMKKRKQLKLALLNAVDIKFVNYYRKNNFSGKDIFIKKIEQYKGKIIDAHHNDSNLISDGKYWILMIDNEYYVFGESGGLQIDADIKKANTRYLFYKKFSNASDFISFQNGLFVDILKKYQIKID
jgi:hypothetical protein